MLFPPFAEGPSPAASDSVIPPEAGILIYAYTIQAPPGAALTVNDPVSVAYPPAEIPFAEDS